MQTEEMCSWKNFHNNALEIKNFNPIKVVKMFPFNHLYHLDQNIIVEDNIIKKESTLGT